MRIGFDGKRAVSNMTGLGNYSRLVIGELAENYPQDSLYVYTSKLKANPRLKKIESMSNVEFRLPSGSGFSGSLWRTFGVTNCLAADKVDVYHGLSNELPLNIASAGVPSVLTMHDVIYRRMPECYTFFDRLIYDFKYGRSCRNATRIIAISKRTKDDIIELYGVDPDKVDIIYQGCDASFKRVCQNGELDEVRRRLHLPSRYVLQVGTIEKRKNLELTVRAMSVLPEEIKLVVVGRDRLGYKKYVEEIAASIGVRDRIIFYHDLAFSDLPAVTQMAELVAYPSRYEGFGIPVLEGLESGRPVVAATGSCLEEAGGDAAFYVSPDDPRAMGEIMSAITQGKIPLEDVVARGKKHASRFNTSNMAAEIMGVYEKAIRDYNL